MRRTGRRGQVGGQRDPFGRVLAVGDGAPGDRSPTCAKRRLGGGSEGIRGIRDSPVVLQSVTDLASFSSPPVGSLATTGLKPRSRV